MLPLDVFHLFLGQEQSRDCRGVGSGFRSVLCTIFLRLRFFSTSGPVPAKLRPRAMPIFRCVSRGEPGNACTNRSTYRWLRYAMCLELRSPVIRPSVLYRPQATASLLRSSALNNSSLASSAGVGTRRYYSFAILNVWRLILSI